MYLRGKTKTSRSLPNFHVPQTGVVEQQHFASPALLWDDSISHNPKTSRQVPLLSLLLEFGSADPATTAPQHDLPHFFPATFTPEKTEQTVKKHVDIFLILREWQRTGLEEPLYCSAAEQ